MGYNFKDIDNLQITDFCCEDCLVHDIVNTMTQMRKGELFEIYAKAELIEEIICQLHGAIIDGNEVRFAEIDFDATGFDYDDVYTLLIDDKYQLWVSPTYVLKEDTDEWKLVQSDAFLSYVYQEDCEQDLIDMLQKRDIPTLLFGFEDE